MGSTTGPESRGWPAYNREGKGVADLDLDYGAVNGEGVRSSGTALNELTPKGYIECLDKDLSLSQKSLPTQSGGDRYLGRVNHLSGQPAPKRPSWEYRATAITTN